MMISLNYFNNDHSFVFMMRVGTDDGVFLPEMFGSGIDDISMV